MAKAYRVNDVLTLMVAMEKFPNGFARRCNALERPKAAKAVLLRGPVGCISAIKNKDDPNSYFYSPRNNAYWLVYPTKEDAFADAPRDVADEKCFICGEYIMSHKS